jgi:hypothetical protein
MPISITTAVKNNGAIEIYNERSQRIGRIVLRPGDRLHGYTSDTVSISSGSRVNVHTYHGDLMFSVPQGGAAGGGGATSGDDWESQT